MTEGGIRLQKFLARAGVASRRASERLIAEGRMRPPMWRWALPTIVALLIPYRLLPICLTATMLATLRLWLP